MDSILLFPPGASGVTGVGSAIQLGSWLNAQAGGDLYGAQGLIESVQAQNALRDGGVFAFRHAPVRKMAIPLLVNTPSPAMWEGMLARYSTPGAYIAVQPEGVPSAQAVYFDVIDGRWEPAYNTYYNRARVREGVLHLDTQPWGYWPTEILLASAASIGFFGNIAVSGASVIGDVPPLAHISAYPTTASVHAASFAAGTYSTDVLAYSLGARPSFNAFIPGASWAQNFTGSVTGDVNAVSSQAIFTVYNGFGAPAWNPIWQTNGLIPLTLEPAYRGRFRAFGLFKMASQLVPNLQLILDAVPFAPGLVTPAMASSNQLATAYFSQPLAPTTMFPGYQLLDMGELAIPGAASGYPQQPNLRIWGAASAAVNTGSIGIFFGGIYLLPVDGAAGILTRGLVVPTVNAGRGVGVEFNANWQESVLAVGSFGAAVNGPFDMRAGFRGLVPRLGASTSTLQILTADRPHLGNAGTIATGMVGQANLEFSQVSVTYRPAFQFLYGI